MIERSRQLIFSLVILFCLVRFWGGMEEVTAQLSSEVKYLVGKGMMWEGVHRIGGGNNMLESEGVPGLIQEVSGLVFRWEHSSWPVTAGETDTGR